MIWSNKAIESKVKINVILFIYHQAVMVFFEYCTKFKPFLCRKTWEKIKYKWKNKIENSFSWEIKSHK